MIREVNMYNFANEVFIPNTTVVIDFWAPWCVPCKMLSPIIEELSNELSSQVKFVSVNIDANPIIAQKCRISSIPTVLIIKNGNTEKSLTGFIPKKKLKKIIEKVNK